MIKQLALVLAGALAAYLLFVAAMRLRGPTPAQATALAVLNQPTPPLAGRDASDAFWLLDHEVPADKQASVATEVRRYYNERAAVFMAEGPQAPDKLVNPLTQFPKRPSATSDEPGLCKMQGEACLPTVRADPAATASTLHKHESGLQAALALSAYDGYRLGVTPTLTQEFPNFSSQRRLVGTYFASLFVDGKQPQALAGLCGDIGAWRRIGGNTDLLIGSMVGAAYARQDLRLLGEMLAEMPTDEPLPAACDSALAPFADYEFDMCPSMRNEFHMMQSTFSQQGGSEPLTDRLLWKAIDKRHIVDTMAPAYARYCEPVVLQTVKQDRPLHDAASVASNCTTLDEIADPIGCSLLQMGATSYSKYVDRRTDLAAILALMRTVLWLRSETPNPADWPAKLPARPASLGLRREPSISADGRTISIPMLEQSRGETFDLLLKPAA
jgi:hypothetical protein